MKGKLLVVAAAVTALYGSAAFAADPSPAELMQQIQQLQAKVQQLEANQQNMVTKADVDATVESILKDADKRSQLFAMEGFTAGWTDGHFMLGSSDGNFKIVPEILLQLRNNTNFRHSGKLTSQTNGNNNNDIQNGFEITRARLEFTGNAFSPDLTYDFSWISGEDVNGNSNSSSLNLENAWVMYRFADQFSFKVGQYKDAIWHEENVKDGEQLAVDRSLVNELLGGGQTDYVQGVSLHYHNGNIRGWVGYHDGYNSDNTNFTDTGGTTAVGVFPTDFGVSGRVEYACMGGFKGYDQFTANGDKDDVVVVGAGIDWSQANSDNVIFHTADIQWNPGAVKGLSLYAAYLGVYRDFNNPDKTPPFGGMTDEFYDWGFVAQAGYMLNNSWELFGRFDYTKLDDDSIPESTEDTLYEITAGVNYYLTSAPWHQHAKVSVDVSWLPYGAGPLGDQSQIGILNNTDDNEIVVRGQFTLQL